MHRLRFATAEAHARLHQIFARDVQWIEDNDGHALRLGVEGRRNAFGSVGEHAGKLIHRDHIVIPGELVRLGRGRAGGEVVKVPAHYQRPRIIQPLERIGPRSQPFCGDGGFLGSIGQQFFFPKPALLICLRGQRPGRVVGKLHFSRIAR